MHKHKVIRPENLLQRKVTPINERNLPLIFSYKMWMHDFESSVIGAGYDISFMDTNSNNLR